jgi:hypothetical protein
VSQVILGTGMKAVELCHNLLLHSLAEKVFRTGALVAWEQLC